MDRASVQQNRVGTYIGKPETTYSVKADCTGTFTIDFTDGRPPVTANFVVVDNGAEIDTVVISATGNQGILATRSIGKRRFFLLP